MSARPALRVSFDPDSPRARWALGVLLDVLGLEATDAGGGAADLSYGPGGRVIVPAGPQDGWDDPDPPLSRDDGLAILHRPGGPARSRGDDGTTLGFDAVYAAYAVLTAPWEPDDPKNDVGTPLAAGGWLARNGVLTEPLVHRYAAVLGRALEVAGLPPGAPRDPAIVVTHDVDDSWEHLFGLRRSWTRLRRELAEDRVRAVRRVGGVARSLARTLAGGTPRDRWDALRDVARRHGGPSTFFVASYGLFDDGAHRKDVGYDIGHTDVGRTLRELAAGGAEIGVHFSLQAARSADQIRRERERLSEAAGVDIRSSRHHYWGLGVDAIRTLRGHADAGIAVDCSFGFNDRPGFRRGIAVPFRPFDPARDEPVPIWSLPTTVMDWAVFDARRSRDDALDELRRIWDTVRDVGGLLVLDWHSHVLNPGEPRGAGRGLVEFVDGAVAVGARLESPLGAITV